ncbi:MAG: hypothetical protein CMJ49_03385 [Planctomycetaceae bacterium]|nr:hypothetical protein [Planctomycetaceae bacterium]
MFYDRPNRLRRAVVVCSFLGALAFTSHTQAAKLVDVQSGVDNGTGLLIPLGQFDDDWQMVSTSDPNVTPLGPAYVLDAFHTVVGTTVFEWFDPEPGYRWIGPINGADLIPPDLLLGTFVYETTFSVPPGAFGLTIGGVMMGDFDVTLLLNGQQIAFASTPDTAARTEHPFFSANQANFNIGGINTLTAVIENGGFQTGFAINATVNIFEIPAPSAGLGGVFVTGLGIVLGRRRVRLC